MQLSITRRFIIITFTAYILSFCFFLVLNNFHFAPKEIDLYFKNSWIINNTLLLFFENLVPVQCISIVFTFSVFYPDRKAAGGLTSKGFSQIVTVVIIILLCLTALFFIGNEIFKPRLYSRIDSYSFLTGTARAYLQQSEEARKEGRLLEAKTALEKYLGIIKTDAETERVYNEVSDRINNLYSINESEQEESSMNPRTLNLSYADAMKLARGYLDIEDYYSAYYYARIASGLSDRSGDAKALTSKAWTALTELSPSKDESEEFSLYNRKKRGTELLLSGKPIDAYYLFTELGIEYPEDPDVKKYLSESIRETVQLTYFIDEAETAMGLPGINDICFLNRNETEIKEIIFIGKMVPSAGGTFFRDIESMIFVPGEGIKSHIAAEYGKLSGDHIVLNGIDRENRNIRIFPEYLVSDQIPEIYNTLKLNTEWNKLENLGSSEHIYKKMSIIELIEFEPIIAEYGWPPEPLYLELITRILQACSFIILSLFMIAVSWKFRRISGRTTIIGFILSPVIIYVAAVASEAYIYGIKILCSWIFLSFGRAAAGGLLAASQILLLLAAFLLIAAANLGGVDNSAE